jgi:hypothetical protein
VLIAGANPLRDEAAEHVATGNVAVNEIAGWPKAMK